MWQQFDDLCQGLDEVGLTCYAAAAVLLQKQLFNVSGVLMSKDFTRIPGINTRAPPHGCVRIDLNGTVDGGHIEVHLTNLGSTKASLKRESDNQVRVQTCNVTLCGRHVGKAREDNREALGGDQISTTNELHTLTQMCSTVLEKVCKGMMFDSHEAIPMAVAEAVLRAVRFPGSRIRLHKVVAKVFFFGDHASKGVHSITAEASRGGQVEAEPNELDHTDSKPRSLHDGDKLGLAHTEPKSNDEDHSFDMFVQARRCKVPEVTSASNGEPSEPSMSGQAIDRVGSDSLPRSVVRVRAGYIE